MIHLSQGSSTEICFVSKNVLNVLKYMGIKIVMLLFVFVDVSFSYFEVAEETGPWCQKLLLLHQHPLVVLQLQNGLKATLKCFCMRLFWLHNTF